MRLQRRSALLLACAAALFAATGASAHDLTCTKTVNGAATAEVFTYPTTLHYRFTLDNVSTTAASVATAIDDPLLSGLGFSFSPAPPVSVPIGGHVSSTFDLELSSFAECERIATGGLTPGFAPQGIIVIDDSVFFDNLLRVTFDSGIALCTARVICHPPEIVPDGGTDGGVDGGTDGGTDGGVDGGTDGGTDGGIDGGTDGGVSGATRTMGFFKTHISAMSQCLASGPIDLGFLTIPGGDAGLSAALGLLWGDPPKFAGGATRSTLDKDRFILARQVLTAVCNERLFGTTSGVVADALAALAGTNCTLIAHFIGPVDAFNNSGDSIDFPSGFDAGPATPGDAKSLAHDPTSPSGLSCSP